MVAATAAGVRRYHEELGHPVDAVRISMPINVRDAADPEATGNHFAPARFPLPLTIEDPKEAMTTIREIVQAERAEPALALVDPLALLLNRLPTSMTTTIFGAALRGVDHPRDGQSGAEKYLSGMRTTGPTFARAGAAFPRAQGDDHDRHRLCS